MSTTATRLITLIMLLQRQPNQKAQDLASELGVSVRTLHRYVSMLDEMGIPIYSERGPYGGFSLVRGYKMPPLVFTPQEAVAVCLGTSLVEEMWGRLYGDAAQGALAKLENLLPDEQRQEIAWARRSLLATGLQRANLVALMPILEKLRQAMREKRRVRLLYQSRGQPSPASRDLDPYALVHRWGWWYVIGYCHLRLEVRTFRVDRIDNLTMLATSFSMPAGFDMRAYLESEPLSQTLMTARLRFSPDAAQVALENRPYWGAYETQPDGAVVVTFDAPTLEWSASTALAFGPLVEVLDPPELRQLVEAWAQAVAIKYATRSRNGMSDPLEAAGGSHGKT